MEYYELLIEKDVDESINNQLASSEYLSCDALRMLNTICAMCKETDVGDTHIGKALSSRLTLRSFPSSLFMMSDEERNTLSSLYPKGNLTHKSNAIVLETNDWTFYMEVVAIVDANENGVPDWVVWVSDEAKQGNYRSYFTLIVYDPAAEGPLVATPFSEHLRSNTSLPFRKSF